MLFTHKNGDLVVTPDKVDEGFPETQCTHFKIEPKFVLEVIACHCLLDFLVGRRVVNEACPITPHDTDQFIPFPRDFSIILDH